MDLPFTLHQLETFVAVAEELHFGRAARRLHTSQPPLSRRIRALEKALGVQLFIRTSRRVELTRAGEAFLIEARRVLDAVERAHVVAEQASADHRLSIGCIESAAIDLLPAVLSRYSRMAPHVAVRVKVLHTREQEEALISGDLSLGILRPPIRSPNLQVEPIRRDPLVAVIPESSDWAPKLGLVQLRDQPFITYSRDMGDSVRNSLLAACSSQGFTPHIAHEVASTAMLLGLVAAGAGVALLPEPYRLTRPPGVKFVALPEVEEQCPVAIAWRADDLGGPAAQIRALAQTAAAITEA